MRQVFKSAWLNWRWPILVGVTGWLAVLLTRTDPGITSDEPFSVLYGMDMVESFTERGAGFFTQASINEIFANRSEHPPLGRWIIGWFHYLLHRGAVRAADFGTRDILDARVASATVFGLMLVLLTRGVAKRSGAVAGVAAGASLLLMPRVFADAHFAALETFVCFTFMLAIFSAAWMMEQRWPSLYAPLAGILLGCAMLTKMHGLLLLPIVGIWALWFFRLRSILPLMDWFLGGVIVFFVGWQWLWGDLHSFWTEWQAGLFSQPGVIHRLPHVFPRLTGFLSSSVDRDAIYVTYLARSLRDTEVPWHYPWVLFAVTVPVGLHVLGLCGVWRQWRQARSDACGWLYLSAVCVPLLIFSLPRIPVYDGVRLFLMVFPLWAVFVGQGAAWIHQWFIQRWNVRWATGLLIGWFACQGFGLWYYHPFQLSYYNLFVCGLRGAERLGFEVTYWGDSITTDFLDRWSNVAPDHSCAVLVPTLYTAHPTLYSSPRTRRKNQTIEAPVRSHCPYLIVYNRRAYLDEVRRTLDDPAQQPLVEIAADGVWLSRVYIRELPPTAHTKQVQSTSDEQPVEPF